MSNDTIILAIGILVWTLYWSWVGFKEGIRYAETQLRNQFPIIQNTLGDKRL